METRAIYMPDARYDSAPIFRKDGDYFVCIRCPEMKYEADVVMCDPDWIIVMVDMEEQKIMLTR